MSDRFNKLIPVILKNEGGYVNDPQDPGGATKYGISLRFLKGTGDLSFDLDHDGDIDVDDICNLIQENAEKLYLEKFYIPLRLDELKNEKLALQIMDMAINAGIKAAVKLLQVITGTKVDGVIGPKTIASANTFLDNIALLYMEKRKWFYLELIQDNPQLAKYQTGWINRCNNTYHAACQL